MSNSETVTVELGAFAARVRERVESGEFDSASEVVQAGLEALEREEADFDQTLRAKIKEAMEDSRPSIPVEDVFDRLEQKHAARMMVTGN